MAFRILTLDGGGAWALIEVRTLINLYGGDTKGHDVLRNFDLVAANSGGSIVLAGLVENLPLSTIAEYFLDQGNRSNIFFPLRYPVLNPLTEALHVAGAAPKYSAAHKLEALRSLLHNSGNSPIAGVVDHIEAPGGSPVRLLIVSFNYDQSKATFFRSTVTSSRGGWGEGQPANATLAGAVHASTNAPVLFFDAPAQLPNVADQFWDGAVTGCNNPVVVAVIEAISLGQDPQNLSVLSLGTGTISGPVAPPGRPADPYETPRPVSSITGDIEIMASSIVDDPPDIATYIAHTITGGRSGLEPPLDSRIVRMSPLVSPWPQEQQDVYRLPAGWSEADFKTLRGTTMDAVEQNQIELIDRYCTTWIANDAPNQAIRENSSKFDPWDPEIGFARFDKARAAWEKLFPRLDQAAGTV